MQATDGTNTQILANQTTGSTTVWSNNADSEVITLPTGIYDIQFVGIVPGGTTASAGDYTLASTVFIPAGVYDGGATSRFDVSITLTEDTEIEPNETVEITIWVGAGYDIAPIQCSGGAKTNAVYTIRDDDARLTLQKTITNDNGGTETDDTGWTLAFDGGSAAVGIDSGAEGVAAVTNAFITEGTFALSESGGPSGYALNNLSCTGAADTSTSVANPNITITPGELVTYEFNNDDVARRLTLVKNIAGGSAVLADFTLSFAGSASGSGISGAGAITNVALDAGSYTISENAVEFYSGALACSGAADGDPSDGLDLAVGEVVTCTFTNTFNPIYDFTVTKSVSVGPTSSLGQSNTITDAGDQISYTIVISNIGNSGLTSFVLTESLPSTAIVCTTSGANTIANLPFGVSKTCSVTYTLLQADFDTNGGGDGDIDNTVSANADGGGSTITRDGSAEVPITQISQIEVTKETDVTLNVQAGQDIIYTYAVTNIGNTNVSNITLADNVTAGSGSAPTPDNEQLATLGGVPLSATTTDATTNQIWDALGPGDVVEFTGVYTVTQSDVDNLQ